MWGSRMVRELIIDNPVARRETRLRFWREWRQGSRTAAVIAVALALASLAYAARGIMAYGTMGDRQSLVLAYGIVLAVAAALVGARSVAGEREVRTWEQVLITRLRPLHIVVGKALGVLSKVAIAAAVLAPALWILVTPQGSSYSHHTPMGPAPGAPAPRAYGGIADFYLFWLFGAALLWMVQGACIGVFASLRYRSTVASGALALVLLAVALTLDFVFAFSGFQGGGTGLAAVRITQLMILSILVTWGWALVVIGVVVGLAAYEFSEFDRWLQAPEGARGR